MNSHQHVYVQPPVNATRTSRFLLGDAAEASAIETNAAVAAPAANALAVVRAKESNRDALARAGVPNAGMVTRFFSTRGGRVNSCVGNPEGTFPLAFRALQFMRAQLFAPYGTFVKSTSASGGGAIVSLYPTDFRPGEAVPAVTLIPAVYVVIGLSKLQAIASASFVINVTAKEESGNSILLSPITANLEVAENNATLEILMTPYRLTKSVMQPTLFSVAADAPADPDFKVEVTGMPDGSQLTVIVPGVDHQVYAEAIAIAANGY